jgi:DNA mismatch repair protein MLH1
MIGKFLLHHTKAFQPLFNQHGASRADVHTVATSSRLDAIRSVYGVSVARSLIKIEIADNNPSTSVFKMDGFISDSNYVAKKITMVLFINGMYYNGILIIVMYFYAPLEFAITTLSAML